MADQHVRWGILGAAKIAQEWLCPAIHMSKRGSIAAIASRSRARAGELASGYGVVTIHESYEALLADDTIDAVYIPLPNTAHVEWTLKCVEAGKHVLCEKPIALAAEELDDLIIARDQSGLHVAEAFMVLHHPQWIKARELVQSGRIGRLKYVQGSFSYYNDDPDNIRNRAEDGGGALRDIGVYPSIVTRYVSGEEPLSVQTRIDWENNIDATAQVWAEFPTFSMDFYVSMRMANRQLMVFHGEEGHLSVTSPFNAKLYGDDVIEIRDSDGNREILRFPLVDHYCEQINNFNDTVLDKVPYPCTLEFSKDNQVMIDMIYAAAQ